MKGLAASTLALLLVGPALAQEKPDSVALTVYSTARPGAVPADLYRPTGGQTYGGARVPG